MKRDKFQWPGSSRGNTSAGSRTWYLVDVSHFGWEIVPRTQSMQTLVFDIHITLHIISTADTLIYFLLLRENRCFLAPLWPSSNYVKPWGWGSLLEFVQFLVQLAIQSRPLSVGNLDLVQTELLWAIWVGNNEHLAYYMLSYIYLLTNFFPTSSMLFLHWWC